MIAQSRFLTVVAPMVGSTRILKHFPESFREGDFALAIAALP